MCSRKRSRYYAADAMAWVSSLIELLAKYRAYLIAETEALGPKARWLAVRWYMLPWLTPIAIGGVVCYALNLDRMDRILDDRHAHFGTDLSDNLANPQTHLAMQHLEPIFLCPDEMIAMMKCCVTTAAVAHSLLSSERMTSRPSGCSFFPRIAGYWPSPGLKPVSD